MIDLYGNVIKNDVIPEDKIILLDLNYTLISNSQQCYGAYPKRIYQQKYETELLDMIKNNYVILITARPEIFKEETLKHIKKLTGFVPNDSYWNTGYGKQGMQPHILKEYWLNNAIFDKYGEDPSQYYAIESNHLTRKMYKKYRIKANKKQDIMAKYK